jgi:hypothetical protein
MCNDSRHNWSKNLSDGNRVRRNLQRYESYNSVSNLKGEFSIFLLGKRPISAGPKLGPFGNSGSRSSDNGKTLDKRR